GEIAMQVSMFAAFVAGLISFLSPCVLPLVPGYISMLSGIGVEQLRQGERPRGSLLTSSVAFVLGFSVVFITFGASASAVGQFLVRNRSLLAPFAGAIIVLFGLHLIGWLGRIPVRGGLVIGGVLLSPSAGRRASDRYSPAYWLWPRRPRRFPVAFFFWPSILRAWRFRFCSPPWESINFSGSTSVFVAICMLWKWGAARCCWRSV